MDLVVWFDYMEVKLTLDASIYFNSLGFHMSSARHDHPVSFLRPVFGVC